LPMNVELNPNTNLDRYGTHVPLASPDPATYYGGGAKGYTDYPAIADSICPVLAG
jgi:hypothetical protein